MSPYRPDAVRESDLDHAEILARGGENCGNEGFEVCKCAGCGRVYLAEYEVDTVFLDAADLTQRSSAVQGFRCECGAEFGLGPWLGEDAPPEMQVTWEELARSPWRWVAERTR